MPTGSVPLMIAGCCEFFNGKLREELLNGEIFYMLREANILIERWRKHYTPSDCTHREDASRRHHRLSCLALLDYLMLLFGAPSRVTLNVGLLTLPVNHLNGARHIHDTWFAGRSGWVPGRILALLNCELWARACRVPLSISSF